MSEIVTRVNGLLVGPAGCGVFDEMASRVRIDDEGDGEFVVVAQCWGPGSGGDKCIRINPEEWPALRDAINRMISEIAGGGADA